MCTFIRNGQTALQNGSNHFLRPHSVKPNAHDQGGIPTSTLVIWRNVTSLPPALQKESVGQELQDWGRPDGGTEDPQFVSGSRWDVKMD